MLEARVLQQPVPEGPFRLSQAQGVLLLDKKAGASELQQVAPEASKPTLLGSPEHGW